MAPNVSGHLTSIFKCKFPPFHQFPTQLLSEQLEAEWGVGGSKNKSHFLLLFSARMQIPYCLPSLFTNGGLDQPQVRLCGSVALSRGEGDEQGRD